MSLNPNTSDLDKEPALPNARCFVKSCHLSLARAGKDVVSARFRYQPSGRCWGLPGSPPDVSYQMRSVSGSPCLACSTESYSNLLCDTLEDFNEVLGI